MYNYNATVERVVDGDTVVLDIDLGFTIHWKSSCRLWGVNTPELKSKLKDERDKAIMAKQFLIDVLPVGSKVFINSRQLDKYGRPLVEIFVNDVNINNEIIDKSLGVVYVP
jgi:micrococcal nuclease